MQKNAFTLIELVVVLTVGILIFSFTLGVGSNFYRSQTLISERDTLLALLRKTRINSMNNVGQSDHGIYIGAEQYVVFEGDSYASRNAYFDEILPRSSGVSVSGPNEVVFTALEGRSNVSGTISIFNSEGRTDVSINYEGRITW